MPRKRGRSRSRRMRTSCLDREMRTPLRGFLMDTITFMDTGRTPARTTMAINSCI